MILIAVPTFENILPETFKSIYDLKGEDTCFEYVRGYDCANARNRIAQIAIDRGAEYVLMVDSDMVIPSDALTNMLSDNCDVVLGYCPRREDSYTGQTCIYKQGWFSYVDESRFTVKELRNLKRAGWNTVAVHGGGMACALIKTDVFKRLSYPWFKWVDYPSGEVLSEDLYFCSRCGEESIPVHVDTRVGCGHQMRHIQFPT